MEVNTKQNLTLEKRMLNLFDKLSGQRHLYAVKGGFVYMLPIMIAGSIAILLNNFPLDSYHNLMLSVFGEGWSSFGGYLWSVTFAVISISATVTISASLATWYKINEKVEISTSQCSIIALSCYLAACYPTEGFLNSSITGSAGLFIAIIISLFTTEFIIFLKKKINIRSFMPVNESDGRIANAFSVMLPSVIILILFAMIRLLIGVYDLKPLNDMVYDIFQKPFNNLGNNLFSAILFILSANFMWVFGIHGNNVLDNVATNIFLPAVYENQAAIEAGQAAPNLFSKTFFDAFVYMGGSGTTVCLILALIIFARRSGQSRLAKISLIPGAFNINELLLYGLPIILNPVYLIPFTLTPLIALLISTFATYIGLVPYAFVEVTWTTPIFMSGYLITGGNIAGTLLQLVNIIIGVAIYRPFVLFAEKLRIKRFKDNYIRLCELCEEDYTQISGKKLISRGDDIGSVARMLSYDLEKAIKEKEIQYYFQPIFNSKTNIAAGAETLLRWQHPIYGFISPMVVIALAEDMGFVRELGRLALHASCAELKKLHDSGNSIYLSINFSLNDLKDKDFYKDTVKIVDSYNIPRSSITIELTETLALKKDEITDENITNLGKDGFGIAIDDFGMGHSSLVYIKHFPITILKVDKALSKDISTVPENIDIITSIYQLCESLGIKMVVEYVENEEQVNILNSIGCNLYQGYYYSKPLPADEFIQYVTDNKQFEKIS